MKDVENDIGRINAVGDRFGTSRLDRRQAIGQSSLAKYPNMARDSGSARAKVGRERSKIANPRSPLAKRL